MKSKRMQRERDTVKTMITKYCQLKHNSDQDLCDECRALLDYAFRRLSRCPFQEGKTTCGKCPIHCYKPEMREKIREVMRVIGPRMLFSHPLMALRHQLDGLRKTPRKL